MKNEIPPRDFWGYHVSDKNNHSCSCVCFRSGGGARLSCLHDMWMFFHLDPLHFFFSSYGCVKPFGTAPIQSLVLSYEDIYTTYSYTTTHTKTNTYMCCPWVMNWTTAATAFQTYIELLSKYIEYICFVTSPFFWSELHSKQPYSHTFIFF